MEERAKYRFWKNWHQRIDVQSRKVVNFLYKYDVQSRKLFI